MSNDESLIAGSVDFGGSPMTRKPGDDDAAAAGGPLDAPSTVPDLPAAFGAAPRERLSSLSRAQHNGGGGGPLDIPMEASFSDLHHLQSCFEMSPHTGGFGLALGPLSRPASVVDPLRTPAPESLAGTPSHASAHRWRRSQVVSIVPGMFVGPFRAANSVSVAQQLRLTAFLNVAKEASRPTYISDEDLDSGRVNYLHLPLVDSATTILEEHFPAVFDFLDAQLAAKRNVLLYCHQGRSRSVSFAIAYLLRTNRLSRNPAESPRSNSPPRAAPLRVMEALAVLRANYPDAEPNVSFCLQLQTYFEGSVSVSTPQFSLMSPSTGGLDRDADLPPTSSPRNQLPASHTLRAAVAASSHGADSPADPPGLLTPPPRSGIIFVPPIAAPSRSFASPDSSTATSDTAAFAVDVAALPSYLRAAAGGDVVAVSAHSSTDEAHSMSPN